MYIAQIIYTFFFFFFYIFVDTMPPLFTFWEIGQGFKDRVKNKINVGSFKGE